MKKFFLYGSAVIVVAIIILGIAAPKELTVQRSTEVSKPVDEVFAYFLSLQNMEQYSPWQSKDPNIKNEYRGTGHTVGSVHRWISDHREVGTGEQEIKSIKENKEIVSELRFEMPFEATSEGFFKFEQVANGTKVTWGYKAEFTFLKSIIMMFIDMDKVQGVNFESGLSKAKSILEQ